MSENNNTLKEQALLQSIGDSHTRYEEKIADLRVELTQVYAELKKMTENYRKSDIEATRLRNQVVTLSNQYSTPVNLDADDILEGHLDADEIIEGEYVPQEDDDQHA
jgi:hypothetical protein